MFTVGIFTRIPECIALIQKELGAYGLTSTTSRKARGVDVYLRVASVNDRHQHDMYVFFRNNITPYTAGSMDELCEEIVTKWALDFTVHTRARRPNK